MLVPSLASEVLAALHQALLHHFHLPQQNSHVIQPCTQEKGLKVTNAHFMTYQYATSNIPLIVDHELYPLCPNLRLFPTFLGQKSRFFVLFDTM